MDFYVKSNHKFQNTQFKTRKESKNQTYNFLTNYFVNLTKYR